jgi:leader peptidase (prepilin peptidase)/N-methyltransferase
MDGYLIETMVFIFGLCIGSFLNVCIYRIPAGRSVVHPGSMCPVCGVSIPFYDNIPVLSYLWLRARCRNCRTSISFRYPMVELLCGLFALCCLLRFGPSLPALIYFAMVAVLLVVTFIDLDHQIIPDGITLPGIPIAFIAGLALPGLTWVDSLAGIGVGGGSLFLVAWGYQLVAKKEGMGGGDIKLLAMIGALIGWQGVLFTVFVSSAVGTVVGLGIMFQGRKNLKLALPYGPFLAIGAIAYIFFGKALIGWYLGML